MPQLNNLEVKAKWLVPLSHVLFNILEELIYHDADDFGFPQSFHMTAEITCNWTEYDCTLLRLLQFNIRC
jgi:hypothetical protein